MLQKEEQKQNPNTSSHTCAHTHKLNHTNAEYTPKGSQTHAFLIAGKSKMRQNSEIEKGAKGRQQAEMQKREAEE